MTKMYTIHAPITNVWQALVDEKIINEWGGGPAKMEAKEGTEFSLWGGDIHGTNTKIVEGKLLVQDWYSGNWEKPSVATFALSGDEKSTKVKLTHTNIPNNEFNDIKSGWDEYYMVPIKKLVEKS